MLMKKVQCGPKNKKDLTVFFQYGNQKDETGVFRNYNHYLFLLYGILI